MPPTARRVFVVAVDDKAASSAYGCGIVRRAGVTVAVSTGGRAPALAGLLRQGLDALLPEDLAVWVAEANRLRPDWRAEGTDMADRRPRLLAALNQLYGATETAGADRSPRGATETAGADRSPRGMTETAGADRSPGSATETARV